MSLLSFITDLNHKLNILLPVGWVEMNDEVVLAQTVLENLNEFFFQTYDGIGTTKVNDKEFQYFSEFHKYWKAHHQEIISAKINREQANLAAKVLCNARSKYGISLFNVTLDTHGIPREAIAQVRFFTANQDFREPPANQFSKYLDDSTQFDAVTIIEDPEEFLKFMKIGRLSQGDKRLDFARHAAEFLFLKQINAFEIAEFFDNDAEQIRNGFLENIGMGYGRKKTDMFIRDMVVLGVWTNLKNIEKIDVASDRNTMKLALRTRILQTELPLLSSFLDIFGYQYSYIDEMSAAAWRAVWEEWRVISPETAPVAPCMMDFLLYRIGREHCDSKLVEFDCENGHRFFYFGARLKRCPQCRAPLTPIRRLLPCQVRAEDLPRFNDGTLAVDATDVLRLFDGQCIFEPTCRPKAEDFRKLSPPKAISIIGRTGWTDSYAIKEEGGGGMMG
jgi:hypothetical protein